MRSFAPFGEDEMLFLESLLLMLMLLSCVRIKGLVPNPEEIYQGGSTGGKSTGRGGAKGRRYHMETPATSQNKHGITDSQLQTPVL